MNTQVRTIYKMKELNLYRIWQIVNILQDKIDELAEQDVFVYLLGHRSNYVQSHFENFLDYYSFKIEEHYISVFNDDDVPYEDYTNDDFISIPKELLSMNDEEILFWAEKEIKRKLEQQEKDKQSRKENILLEIERLNKEYKRL